MPHSTQPTVPQSPMQYCMVHSPAGLTVTPDTSTFHNCSEGYSFPDLLPSDHTINTESVVGAKHGASDVVTGYQLNNFTCTWLADHFVV